MCGAKVGRRTLYGSVANRQLRRAVNPFPLGVVGSAPTWPTINKFKARKGRIWLYENLQIEFGVTNVGYKYVLLPVYVGHTEYKGERYQLFVNGQTGKVYGKTPKSKWKIFSFFAL